MRDFYDELCLVTVNRDCAPLVLTLLESWAEQHRAGKLPVVVAEVSADPASRQELAAAGVPVLQMDSTTTDGAALDAALLAAWTPFALVCSPDAVFHGSFAQALDRLKAQAGAALMGEHESGPPQRVSPACCLVRLPWLRQAGAAARFAAPGPPGAAVLAEARRQGHTYLEFGPAERQRYALSPDHLASARHERHRDLNKLAWPPDLTAKLIPGFAT
jgi:hypothetical protein